MKVIRKNISDIIFQSVLKQHGNTKQLAADSGLPQSTINNLITHGMVELADWVAICSALGLDAGAALSEAANRRSDTPVALSGAAKPQPISKPAWQSPKNTKPLNDVLVYFRINGDDWMDPMRIGTLDDALDDPLMLEGGTTHEWASVTSWRNMTPTEMAIAVDSIFTPAE